MGKLYLHFWVAKWILAAGLELFDSNEAYQTCYLQEVCGDDSDFAPLFGNAATAPLRGARLC